MVRGACAAGNKDQAQCDERRRTSHAASPAQRLARQTHESSGSQSKPRKIILIFALRQVGAHEGVRRLGMCCGAARCGVVRKKGARGSTRNTVCNKHLQRRQVNSRSSRQADTNFFPINLECLVEKWTATGKHRTHSKVAMPGHSHRWSQECCSSALGALCSQAPLTEFAQGVSLDCRKINGSKTVIQRSGRRGTHGRWMVMS